MSCARIKLSSESAAFHRSTGLSHHQNLGSSSSEAGYLSLPLDHQRFPEADAPVHKHINSGSYVVKRIHFFKTLWIEVKEA